MRVMGGTQRSRLVVNLLAPVFAVAATSLPAAAQDGSEAIVCVGSERRTLAPNPMRRVYTEDMDLLCRIGAGIGHRDQVERTLSLELGSYSRGVVPVVRSWGRPRGDHPLHGRHPPASDSGPGGPEVSGLQRGASAGTSLRKTDARCVTSWGARIVNSKNELQAIYLIFYILG